MNITIDRLKIRPGDRLIVHVDDDTWKISAQQAVEIKRRLKAALALDWDIPVAIVGRGWDITVEDA